MNYSPRSWSIFLAAAVVFAVYLPAEDASAQRSRRGGRGGNGWDFVAKKYDADKDGTVTSDEYTRSAEGFKSLDRDGDGKLTQEDWAGGSQRGRGSGEAPEVGDEAPDFSLTRVRDKSKTITLSGFSGKQPVALLFGSCT